MTPGDVRISISKEREDLAWLYEIIEEPGPRTTSKPLIQTVAHTLRGISSNKTCFDPSVVSFGPYHHGKDHLKPMERYKKGAARWFIKLSANTAGNAIAREGATQVYDNFVAKFPSVSSLRDCYTDKFFGTINDADFMRMMFLDGCFMLYFIQLFQDQPGDPLETSHPTESGDPLETSHPTESGDPLETSHLTRPLILRDMFLLENQIPYSVFVALKSLKPSLMPGGRDDWAASFFKTVFLPPPSSVVSHSLSMVLTPLVHMILVCTLLPVLVIGLKGLGLKRLGLTGLEGGLFFSVNFVFVVFGVSVAAVLLEFSWIVGCWICHSRRSADPRFEEVTEPQTEPLHLLDLLRSEHTGKGLDPSVHGTCCGKYKSRPISELKAEGIHTGKGLDPSVHGTRCGKYKSRPISELKAAGILVSASNSESLSLNNIKLKKGWIDSFLELPRIIIDDWTKTHLLNLAAYEMCPDGSLGKPVITSYICFLNSLIYNADDVKELRSSDIMLNRLGSDEEVVNLFTELATNLSPDFNAYNHVTRGMEEHSRRCFNRPRMYIGQFIRIYFTSPWPAISLTAASSILFFTMVQAIYSVLSFHDKEPKEVKIVRG